eukprot:scaffold664_cov260-Pinguiococcus_pyrenoidosus.AAC.39
MALTRASARSCASCSASTSSRRSRKARSDASKSCAPSWTLATPDLALLRCLRRRATRRPRNPRNTRWSSVAASSSSRRRRYISRAVIIRHNPSSKNALQRAGVQFMPTQCSPAAAATAAENPLDVDCGIVKALALRSKSPLFVCAMQGLASSHDALDQGTRDAALTRGPTSRQQFGGGAPC